MKVKVTFFIFHGFIVYVTWYFTIQMKLHCCIIILLISILKNGFCGLHNLHILRSIIFNVILIMKQYPLQSNWRNISEKKPGLYFSRLKASFLVQRAYLRSAVSGQTTGWQSSILPLRVVNHRSWIKSVKNRVHICNASLVLLCMFAHQE